MADCTSCSQDSTFLTIKRTCRAWSLAGCSRLPNTTHSSGLNGNCNQQTAARSKRHSKKRDLGEAENTGSNPTDRGKCGCERHVLSDTKGIPLAVVVSGANRHDMKKLEALLKAVKIQRPSDAEHEVGFIEGLCLDKGDDFKACRAMVLEQGYEGHIKARGEEKVVLEGAVVHPARRWVRPKPVSDPARRCVVGIKTGAGLGPRRLRRRVRG